MKAVQQQNQRVHQFVTWVKNTASRAGITDSKMLGRVIYKGVLPELLKAAKGSIPENGFTLEGAITWALYAERTLDSIVYAMENRTGTANSKKRKHTDTVESSIIAPISAQPVKKLQPPQKSKGGAKNNKASKNNSEKRAPQGTPTGILYLIKDKDGKNALHPKIKEYRTAKNLCLKCGGGIIPLTTAVQTSKIVTVRRFNMSLRISKSEYRSTSSKTSSTTAGW